MSVKTKEILIFLCKVLIVAGVTVYTFFEPYWLAVLLYLCFPLPFILGIGILIGLSELFPAARKGTNFFIRHILQPLLLMATIGITVLLCLFFQWQSERVEEFRAQSYVENAEEHYSFNINNFYFDDILGTGLQHDTVMLDHDTMTVSVLRGYLYGELYVFPLDKSAPITDRPVQNTLYLEELGGELVFFATEEYPHMTEAIQLTMTDGTIYTADDLRESDGGYLFLGLDGTHFERVHLK